LTFLAEMEEHAGDVDAAVALMRRARDGYQRAGDDDGVALTVAGLSLVALEAGDVDSGLALSRDGLERAWEKGAPRTVAQCFAGVAAAYAAAGRIDDAARLWGAVERMEDESGVPIQERERVLLVRGPLDEARVAEGRALSGDEAVALAAVSSPA
jgi:hypothetical protein